MYIFIDAMLQWANVVININEYTSVEGAIDRGSGTEGGVGGGACVTMVTITLYDDVMNGH